MVKGEGGLKAHLSSAEVWSFSLGTSVGWGSVIITCNTYLASAGPVGTVAGLIVVLSLWSSSGAATATS